MAKRIMGIDISFTATGWIVADVHEDGYTFVAAGCIVTEPDTRKGKVRVSDDDVRRCQFLMDELMRTCFNYLPQGLAIELPTSGAKGARAMHCMGMAKGISGAVASVSKKTPIEWPTPTEVKKALCGSKTASKEDMIARAQARMPACKALFGAKNRAEHIADALGALYAIMGGQMHRMMLQQ